MARLRELISRLWGTLRRRRADRELEDELQLHLELAAEDARRRGGSVESAARTARLRAGDIPQAMDALRDQRGLPGLEDLARDLRHGLRTLRRSPGFAVVALLTLGIGIGANTAVFSVVNGVLLKPLPYPNADELVAVWQTAPGAPGLSNVSGDLRSRRRCFSRMPSITGRSSRSACGSRAP
jgi:hypothetical protein